jgi:hypothetical protein
MIIMATMMFVLTVLFSYRKHEKMNNVDIMAGNEGED